MPDLIPVGTTITPELQESFRLMESRAKHGEFNSAVLGDVIKYLDERFGFDAETWTSIINMVVTIGVGHNRAAFEIEDILTTFAGVDESMFLRSFVCDVTVPVYFSMRVDARDEDTAHDVAYEEIQNMWVRDILDSYDIDVDSSMIEITHIHEEA